MLRLCSPGRLAAVLLVEVIAATVGLDAHRLASQAYMRLLGLPAPAHVTGLASMAAVAAMGAAIGIALRSPSLGAAVALAGAQWVPQGLPLWPLPAAPLTAILAGAPPLALGLLAGAPGDSGLRLRGTGRDPLRTPLLLALAASSTAVAALSPLARCGLLWASGSLVAAALAPLVPGGGLGSVAVSLAAGLGWHGASVALALAALAPVEPPRCGGVEGLVHAVYGWHPSHLLLGRPKPRWWGWGFACSRSTGTLAPTGPRGALIIAWGPRARDAASTLLARLGGSVLCAGCNTGYWKARGLEGPLRFRPGAGTAKLEPGAIVAVDSPEPAEHLLTLAGSLETRGGIAALVIDAPGAWSRLLEAAVDELLGRAAPIVVVVHDAPSPPPRLRPPGAHVSTAAAGPLPARLLEALLPLAPGSAASVGSLLAEGYAVFYPSCGGAAVAARVEGV